MKAWHFTGIDEPLVKVELPDPVAGPGEVVIDVKAAGLCHTDVGVLHDEGWLSTLAYRPIVIGHEVSGTVAEVGEGVSDWQVGDRVGICPTTPFGAPGFVTDGGFGEKVCCPASALVRIPDGVSFALGAAGAGYGQSFAANAHRLDQFGAGDASRTGTVDHHLHLRDVAPCKRQGIDEPGAVGLAGIADGHHAGGDQVAREDEEDRHPGEAALHPLQLGVPGQHPHEGEPPQPVERSDARVGGTPRVRRARGRGRGRDYDRTHAKYSLA